MQKADELMRARAVIVQTIQQEAFKEEIKSLIKGETVSKFSPLRKLNPILDADGVLRIGGRHVISCDLLGKETSHKHP